MRRSGLSHLLYPAGNRVEGPLKRRVAGGCRWYYHALGGGGGIVDGMVCSSHGLGADVRDHSLRGVDSLPAGTDASVTGQQTGPRFQQPHDSGAGVRPSDPIDEFTDDCQSIATSRFGRKDQFSQLYFSCI